MKQQLKSTSTQDQSPTKLVRASLEGGGQRQLKPQVSVDSNKNLHSLVNTSTLNSNQPSQTSLISLKSQPKVYNRKENKEKQSQNKSNQPSNVVSSRIQLYGNQNFQMSSGSSTQRTYEGQMTSIQSQQKPSDLTKSYQYGAQIAFSQRQMQTQSQVLSNPTKQVSLPSTILHTGQSSVQSANLKSQVNQFQNFQPPTSEFVIGEQLATSDSRASSSMSFPESQSQSVHDQRDSMNQESMASSINTNNTSNYHSSTSTHTKIAQQALQSSANYAKNGQTFTQSRQIIQALEKVRQQQMNQTNRNDQQHPSYQQLQLISQSSQQLHSLNNINLHQSPQNIQQVNSQVLSKYGENSNQAKQSAKIGGVQITKVQQKNSVSTKSSSQQIQKAQGIEQSYQNVQEESLPSAVQKSAQFVSFTGQHTRIVPPSSNETNKLTNLSGIVFQSRLVEGHTISKLKNKTKEQLHPQKLSQKQNSFKQNANAQNSNQSIAALNPFGRSFSQRDNQSFHTPQLNGNSQSTVDSNFTKQAAQAKINQQKSNKQSGNNLKETSINDAQKIQTQRKSSIISQNSARDLLSSRNKHQSSIQQQTKDYQPGQQKFASTSDGSPSKNLNQVNRQNIDKVVSTLGKNGARTHYQKNRENIQNTPTIEFEIGHAKMMTENQSSRIMDLPLHTVVSLESFVKDQNLDEIEEDAFPSSELTFSKQKLNENQLQDETCVRDISSVGSSPQNFNVNKHSSKYMQSQQWQRKYQDGVDEVEDGINGDYLRMIKIKAIETPKTQTPTILLKHEPLIKSKSKQKIQSKNPFNRNTQSQLSQSLIDEYGEDIDSAEELNSKQSSDKGSILSQSSTQSIRAKKMIKELNDNKRQSAMGVVTHSNYYINENLTHDNLRKTPQRESSESTAPLDHACVQVQVVDDYQSKYQFQHKKSINNNYYAHHKDAISQRSNDKKSQHTPGMSDNGSSRQRVRVRINPKGRTSIESSTSETPNSITKQDILARAKATIKQKMLETYALSNNLQLSEDKKSLNPNHINFQHKYHVSNVPVKGEPINSVKLEDFPHSSQISPFTTPTAQTKNVSGQVAFSNYPQVVQNSMALQMNHSKPINSSKFSKREMDSVSYNSQSPLKQQQFYQIDRTRNSQMKEEWSNSNQKRIAEFSSSRDDASQEDQVFTNLLLQNPSTKHLLEKINEKQKHLGSQKHLTESRQNSSKLLITQQSMNEDSSRTQDIPQTRPSGFKTLSLPKRQQMQAVKVDLGDSPNVTQIVIEKDRLTVPNDEDSKLSRETSDQASSANQSQKPTTLLEIGNKTVKIPIKSSRQFLDKNHQIGSEAPFLKIDGDFQEIDCETLRMVQIENHRKGSQQLIDTVTDGIGIATTKNLPSQGLNDQVHYNYRSIQDDIQKAIPKQRAHTQIDKHHFTKSQFAKDIQDNEDDLSEMIEQMRRKVSNISQNSNIQFQQNNLKRQSILVDIQNTEGDEEEQIQTQNQPPQEQNLQHFQSINSDMNTKNILHPKQKTDAEVQETIPDNISTNTNNRVRVRVRVGAKGAKSNRGKGIGSESGQDEGLSNNEKSPIDERASYSPEALRVEDLIRQANHQRFGQSIAQIQIEKVNEEYCLQQSQVKGHSKKNTIFCQSAIVTENTHRVEPGRNNFNPLASAESPYQINSSTTPNAQNMKKKPLVKRFKYKNLTENQTPSSKSFMTDNNRASIDTPQSDNNSLCGSQLSKNENIPQTSYIPHQIPKFHSQQNNFNKSSTSRVEQGNNYFNFGQKVEQLHSPTFIQQDENSDGDSLSAQQDIQGHLLRNNEMMPSNSSQNIHRDSSKSDRAHLQMQQSPDPDSINNNFSWQFEQQTQNQTYLRDQPQQHSKSVYSQEGSSRTIDFKSRQNNKIQATKIDENKKISLPMRKNNSSATQSSNGTLTNATSEQYKLNKSDNNTHLNREYQSNQNPRNIKQQPLTQRDGAICSADISDNCSVDINQRAHGKDKMPTTNSHHIMSQELSNKDLHHFIQSSNASNILKSQQSLSSFHQSSHKHKKTEIQIREEEDFIIHRHSNNNSLTKLQASVKRSQEQEEVEFDQIILHQLTSPHLLSQQMSSTSIRALNQTLGNRTGSVLSPSSNGTFITRINSNKNMETLESPQSIKAGQRLMEVENSIGPSSFASKTKSPDVREETKSNTEADEEQETEENNYIEEEEQLAARLPTIKGTVYKKIDNPKKVKNGKSYKKRYGLVRNKKFKYYKDKDMRELGGVFDFDILQCVIMIDDGSSSNYQSMQSSRQDHLVATEESDSPSGKNNLSNRYIEPKKFRIEVIGSKRNFVFHVQSSSALRQWTQALYANWHASKSFTLNNLPKQLATPFWKSEVIQLTTFRKLADTGDIVLFTGSSFVTRVQRALTMSDYDHVAMLLRYSNGKLVMFESTGQTGVAVLDWDLFVKNNWQKLYTKLCFRKLRHNRSLETMQKLETFIRTVIGMKYKLNPSKILRKKYENDAENIEKGEDKSYFCSELVASAYKCMGLLPKEISASQYWPGSFSQKSGLKLIGDSMLEDEQTIVFDQQ